MHRARNGGVSQRIEPPVDVEVRQLRAFVTLVEVGRVTAAAQALGLAQSTVSEAIAALERALGAPVVLRRRGSPNATLTSAGHALLPHARKVLTAVDAARAAVAEATRTARTHLNIVANESVSTYLLPAVLASLRTRWPNTQFTVSVATGAGVSEGVAGGAFDLGLMLARAGECEPARRPPRPRTSTPSPGRRVVISDVRLVMFADASHPDASGVLRRSALAAYPLFVSDAAFEFDTFVQRYIRSGHAAGPHVEAAGSVEGVKKAVMAHRGALGLLPAYALAEELRLRRVVGLDLRPPPPRMRLDALLSPLRTSHPATTELLDAVRDAFGSGAASPVQPCASVPNISGT